MAENISFNTKSLGAPVDTLSYEQARAELENVVRQLESGASIWRLPSPCGNAVSPWRNGARRGLRAPAKNLMRRAPSSVKTPKTGRKHTASPAG